MPILHGEGRGEWVVGLKQPVEFPNHELQVAGLRLVWHQQQDGAEYLRVNLCS